MLFEEKSLSYDIASGSEITPCIKIEKPLVVYRFSENVMKRRFSRQKFDFKVIFRVATDSGKQGKWSYKFPAGKNQGIWKFDENQGKIREFEK